MWKLPDGPTLLAEEWVDPLIVLLDAVVSEHKICDCDCNAYEWTTTIVGSRRTPARLISAAQINQIVTEELQIVVTAIFAGREQRQTIDRMNVTDC